MCSSGRLIATNSCISWICSAPLQGHQPRYREIGGHDFSRSSVMARGLFRDGSMIGLYSMIPPGQCQLLRTTNCVCCLPSFTGVPSLCRFVYWTASANGRGAIYLRKAHWHPSGRATSLRSVPPLAAGRFEPFRGRKRQSVRQFRTCCNPLLVAIPANGHQ